MPPGKEPLWLIASLLNPVVATEPSERPYRRIYRPYFREAPSLFALTDLADADLAVIPTDWSSYHGSYSLLARPDRTALNRTQRFAEAARRKGKPVVVFFAGERSHERVPLPGAWVFRRSMYRSHAGERDVPLPEIFYLDLLDQLGLDRIRERPWRPVPTVGFCGFARRQRPAEYLNQLAFHGLHLARERWLGVSPFRGLELRRRALDLLASSPLVRTEFLARDQSVFFGGDKSRREQYRREFLDNLLGADYQLSVRGSANYSYRPWEAMCVGRPPLFVDTDCAWPFAGDVDWSKLMVIVDESDIGRLPEALADFHAGLDEERFRALQEACRATWESHLTPHGLARWLHAFFRDRLSV